SSWPSSCASSASPEHRPVPRPSGRGRGDPAEPIPRRPRHREAAPRHHRPMPPNKRPGPRGTGVNRGEPGGKREKAPPKRGLLEKSGDDLLSQGESTQVPSAQSGLTSVFGKGTGVTQTR